MKIHLHIFQNYDDIAEIFNCHYSERYRSEKKFALRALKSTGFGTKESEGKVGEQQPPC